MWVDRALSFIVSPVLDELASAPLRFGAGGWARPLPRPLPPPPLPLPPPAAEGMEEE